MGFDNEWETTDVLICGCGPTGAMLSGYLGRMSVSNVVLEKEESVTTDPRGIALDEDGIRFMQGLGLYEHIFTSIGSCVPKLRFVGGVHHDLQAKPFLCFDTASTRGNTGHVGMLGHNQSVLEKYLRSVLNASNHSQLRTSCTLTSIAEDNDWVYAAYVDAAGKHKRIRSRFLAAADGKTGFTRKHYLEAKGIRLERAEQTKYEETWVALNWKLHLPTKETHPSFPLWDLGYSPEQVRPAVCGRFGLQQDRLWRFEFIVAPGEDGTEMAQPHKIREVVFPYLRHPGVRYGLAEDVEYPEGCIEVLRSRPFRFSARSCNKWALGRVALCGDAAHVFPPFGGQGIASGFRDATSLAWRLAIACRPNRMLDHEHLLACWYKERKQQLEKSLASTLRNGDMVNSRNPVKIFIRDWVLWFLRLAPSWKHWLELGPRSEKPVQYAHMTGMPFIPELQGGISFPQAYCSLLKESSPVRFTDDAIFGDGKGKLFQIVVLLHKPNDIKAAATDLDGIDRISEELSPEEATFFVQRKSLSGASARGELYDRFNRRLFRTAADNEFAQSNLCAGRPLPRGYNEALMWQAVKGKRYVILRPDRFAFAVCNTRLELELAARKLSELFQDQIDPAKVGPDF